MLSYQHGYHAGNFADVIKHFTLTRLITYLTTKEKPIFYLETHSGRGIYDFKDSQALKTKEFLSGIALVWQQKEKLSSLFNPYLTSLRNLNPKGELRFYPGSPKIAIEHLREQDRLFCCELHPREYERLNELNDKSRRVHFSNTDGMHQLIALLPPQEKRGLIFIDPSYEMKNDYKTVPTILKKAHAQFSSGTYCLWYPLVDNHLHQQLLRGLTDIPANNKLRVEFYLTAARAPGMTGCGLWIINPPYTLAKEMKEALSFLRPLFNPPTSSFLIES